MQMQIEEGDSEDRIAVFYCLFYFNLSTGDYTTEYCLKTIKELELKEDYEACAGIVKALNFYHQENKNWKPI